MSTKSVKSPTGKIPLASLCVLGICLNGALAADYGVLERATIEDAPRAATTPNADAPVPTHSAVDAIHDPQHSIEAPTGHDAVKPAAPPAAPSMTRPTERLAPKVEWRAATTEQSQKEPIATPSPGKPASPPPLDLKSLERRLKETQAIGLFTKIVLKNQVDDLLDQFRAFYQGRHKGSLAELRQSYDSLLLKVLALLQDADPPLAHAILASREAIWNILTDPDKFATL